MRRILGFVAVFAIANSASPAWAQYPAGQQSWQQQQQQPWQQQPQMQQQPQFQQQPTQYQQQAQFGAPGGQSIPGLVPQQNFQQYQSAPPQGQGGQPVFYGQAAESQAVQPESLPPGAYLGGQGGQPLSTPTFPTEAADNSKSKKSKEPKEQKVKLPKNSNHEGIKTAAGSIGKALGRGLGVAAPLAGGYMLMRAANKGGMGSMGRAMGMPMGGMGMPMGGMMNPYGYGGMPMGGMGLNPYGYNPMMGGGMMNPAAGLTNLMLP